MRRSAWFLALALVAAACVAASGEVTTTSGVGSTSPDAVATTLGSTTSTVSTSPSSTTLPPPEPVVIVDASQGAGLWGVWNGLSREGLPVMVYPAGMDSYGFGATSLRMATCSDPYCAGGVTLTDLFEAEEPRFIERFEATVGPSGYPVVVFNTWDFSSGEEDPSQLETWVMICGDAACSAPTMSQIGPWPNPDEPQGWTAMDSFGVTADDSQVVVGYRHWTTEYVFSIVQCDEGECGQDRSQDPVVFAQHKFVGDLSLTWSISPEGAPALVFGYAVGDVNTSSDWRLVLLVCGDRSCESTTVNEVPSQPGTMRWFDLSWGPEGYPVIVHDAWRQAGFTVWLTTCQDPLCDSYEETAVLASPDPMDWKMTTGPDGFAVFAWIDDQNQVMLSRCATIICDTIDTLKLSVLSIAEMPAMPPIAFTFGSQNIPTITIAAEDGIRIFNCLPENCAQTTDS